MDADNTYHPYSGAEILRYLDGRMTKQEMRQLELAAMDDPFLEDAIDGYREAYASSGKDKVAAGLATVQAYKAEAKVQVENKEEEQQEKTSIVIPIWRRKAFQMAVAAMLIVGAGWYIFSVTNPSKFSPNKKETAQEIVSTTTKDTNSIATLSNGKTTADSYTYKKLPTTDTEAQAETSRELAVVSTPKDKPSIPAAAAPVTLSAKAERDFVSADSVGTFVSPPALAKAESNTNAKEARDQRQVDNEVATVVIPSPAAKSRAISQQHLEDTKLQKISGKVVDGEKYPLDNITLRFKGRPGATLSDELGRFELELPDTNAILIASGPGFKTKEFAAKSSFAYSKKLELQLEPEKSLEEEVVTGYMNSRKRAQANAAKPTVLEMDTTEASPVGGWDNFVKYVKQNKRFKDRPGSLSIAVVINFEVDEEGRLGEFEIKKSGGDAYDKEAIRLLKEGPAWKIKLEEEEIGAVKITMVL